MQWYPPKGQLQQPHRMSKEYRYSFGLIIAPKQTLDLLPPHVMTHLQDVKNYTLHHKTLQIQPGPPSAYLYTLSLNFVASELLFLSPSSSKTQGPINPVASVPGAVVSVFLWPGENRQGSR